jgi:23S rRNA (pseudouridine1915-N3)-methyltransferase
MKFSDVNTQSWNDLRPYVDTCLLPITGLSGLEQPWEAARALEELRDALDLFEIPYKGRVMTYPACHYIFADNGMEFLNQICDQLKKSGFAYVIAVSANLQLQNVLDSINADLSFSLTPEFLVQSLPEAKLQISEAVMHLWKSKN